MDGLEVFIVFFDKILGDFVLKGFLLSGSGRHIESDLGEFSDVAGEFAEGLLRFRDDFGNHEGSEDAIAGGFVG